jgi:glycosyltransferase involved in cell wall biosynthesis
LRGPAGVERHFLEFVNELAGYNSDWRQSILATGGSVHPYISQSLDNRITLLHEKSAGSIRLPKYPSFIRRWHTGRIIRKTGPELVVIWNRPSRSGDFLQSIGKRKWVYWEHGSAWHKEYKNQRKHFYRAAPFIIANSYAALRVLQLQWNVQAPTEVCLNALRPSIKPDHVAARQYPVNRRLRLGMVSRLVPLKGGPLVIYALSELIKAGLDVELHIAGEGGLRDKLSDLADGLSVAGRLIWHGLVRDMSTFYRSIDCLVHPALHEPFGLIGIEAAAYGCPVITAAIDGLPEAVRNGESGYCLQPEVPLNIYKEYGGSTDGLPEYVYDPQKDKLVEPLFVEPGKIAASIMGLANNPASYDALSRGGINAIDQYYDFTKHTAKVSEIFARLIQ